jgi:hypothetical protein
MIIYHQVDADSIESILRDGLKTHLRGDKESNTAIAQADAYLDDHRPESIVKANVSRQNNAYGYVGVGQDQAIDITDGSIISVHDLSASEQQILVKLDVDANRCFVSNLDAFDAVKSAHSNAFDERHLQQLSDQYWRSIVPLPQFDITKTPRPEVMITYDVPPENITRLS